MLKEWSFRTVMIELCCLEGVTLQGRGLMATVCLSSLIFQIWRPTAMWWLCYPHDGSLCRPITVCTLPQLTVEEQEGCLTVWPHQTGVLHFRVLFGNQAQRSIILVLPRVQLLSYRLILTANTTYLSSSTSDFCLRWFDLSLVDLESSNYEGHQNLTPQS